MAERKFKCTLFAVLGAGDTNRSCSTEMPHLRRYGRAGSPVPAHRGPHRQNTLTKRAKTLKSGHEPFEN